MSNGGEAMDALGPVNEEFGALLFDVGEEMLASYKASQKAERRRELREHL